MFEDAVNKFTKNQGSVDADDNDTNAPYQNEKLNSISMGLLEVKLTGVPTISKLSL